MKKPKKPKHISTPEERAYARLRAEKHAKRKADEERELGDLLRKWK